MDIKLPKLNIEKNKQELQIFIFTIQGGTIKIDMPEDIQTVMAYNDNDALNLVKKSYPLGSSIMVKKRASLPVRRIINAVIMEPAEQSGGTTSAEIKFLSDPPKIVDNSVEKFLYSLMLVVDKYITNKRDQATIKRIINKIKIHEDQPAPTTEKNPA